MRARTFPILAVAAVTLLVIAACTGNGATAIPTAAPVPSAEPRVDNGATAAPTAAPVSSAEPRVDNAATATPTAARVSSAEPTVDGEGLTVVASPTETKEAATAPPTKSLPQILRELVPSIVHIQTEAVRLDMFNRAVPASGVGTGAIWDKKGHIVTNNHVVAGASRILVTLSDGRALEAKLIGGDLSLDLAVLRVDGRGLIPMPLGTSSMLQVGDQVTAIGHALNLEGGPTVTGGWVSALDRSLDVSPTITMRHLIQTDAAINPGNSGGPLINMRGEMVGMNTAKLPSGEGIGFAIAIDPALPMIQELIDRGVIERGFLGISAITIDETLAMNLGLPVSEGIGVSSVAPDSPAELAGLEAGDIIARVEGRDVRKATELDSVLLRYRSGADIDVEFYRGDTRNRITVTLGDRPS